MIQFVLIVYKDIYIYIYNVIHNYILWQIGEHKRFQKLTGRDLFKLSGSLSMSMRVAPIKWMPGYSWSYDTTLGTRESSRSSIKLDKNLMYSI